MKVAVSGAGGLVGSALVTFLATNGHTVRRMTRSQPSDIAWNSETRTIDTAALEGLDAVVHLAGESIAAGRWTAAKKARIRGSRVNGTRLLAETLASLADPPKALVCASAIGYYGDRADEVLREDASSGTNFLADICREWEAGAQPAVARGIRVVNLRFGVILSANGGALAKMLLPFKMGLGGIIGSGRQYMSWITLDDAIGAIHHVLTTDRLRGPVNATSPQPVTNREFTTALGRVLRRPTIFPMPAFAARFAFGQMADELLLASARVEPAKLLASGYTFRQPHLAGALRYLLGR
jgi:uncharacterized protein